MTPGRMTMTALVLVTTVMDTSSARANLDGYLQVKAPPNASVTLEGIETKIAEDDDGVIFRGLETGRYWITIAREGFEQQRGTVDVAAASVAVFHPKPWQPVSTVGVPKKKATVKMGALIVQTFPVDATVDAKRLGWRKIKKGDKPFIASNVPAGTHKITFCNTYKCLDYRATIQANRILSIIVDFEPGEIEDVSEIHRQQLAQWRSGCAKGAEGACRRACDLDVALSPRGDSVSCASLAKQTQTTDHIVPVNRALSPP